MAGEPKKWSLAHWVHLTLLTGLVASSLLMLVGLVALMVNHQPRPVKLPVKLEDLLRHALVGDGLAILDLGLLLLMLTPALRVMVLGVGWLQEREWRFAMVALIVLALLATSVFLGMD